MTVGICTARIADGDRSPAGSTRCGGRPGDLHRSKLIGRLVDPRVIGVWERIMGRGSLECSKADGDLSGQEGRLMDTLEVVDLAATAAHAGTASLSAPKA